MLNLPEQELYNPSDDKELVLSVKNVSKRFCRDLKRSLLYGIQDIAGEVFGAQRQNVKLRKSEFWALKDVCLELRRGEALGLVGANGAGKTTLLRVISGLITPDHGSIEVKGRVAPLIALGAGFNPILTGRENIYVNMSILGLSKEEIEDRFDEVVDFAGIGESIDSPLQSYSSGMAARLGFASAIHTEPDILLIDEVLAVGDAKFRAKCYRRLSHLREKGTSFILVTHDSLSIMAICDTAIYLSKGQNVFSGTANVVVNKYEEDLFLGDSGREFSNVGNEMILPDKQDNYGLHIKSVSFRDKNYKVLEYLSSGRLANLTISGIAFEKVNNINLSVIINCLSGSNEEILVLKSSFDDQTFDFDIGKFTLQLQLPYCGLKAGIYSAKINLSDSLYFNILAFVESFKFTVKSNENMSKCSFYQPRNWIMIDEDSL